MPKIKTLSAKEVLQILYKFGFEIKSQKGSHIKLQRINNAVEILIIPNHKVIDKGTLGAIYRKASTYIGEEDLEKYFYHQ